MEGYRRAVGLFPPLFQNALSRVDTAICRRVQEIRLRAGQAVCVCFSGQQWYVGENGTLCSHSDGCVCDGASLQRMVDRLIAYSLYAHEDDLRQGFVTAEGCRVGIAGTAVTERGTVVGYRRLTGVCVRVSRAHPGCASVIADVVCDGIHSALIGGEPSAGKTSLLRDLATQFSDRRIPVTVVDERGELGDCFGCDVLRATPKAAGILQAVRCLAPKAVLVDELGDGEELKAVQQAALRGVPVIATVHCRTPRELRSRGGLRELLESGVFEYVIGLRGRDAPGRIAQILRTEEWLSETDRSGTGAGDGDGMEYDDAPTTAQPYRVFDTG